MSGDAWKEGGIDATGKNSTSFFFSFRFSFYFFRGVGFCLLNFIEPTNLPRFLILGT